MKGIAFLCFQTPGLEKIWLVKNALIQSDYRIFLSLISVEIIHQCL